METIKLALIIGGTSLFVTGCGQAESPKPGPPPGKGTVQTAIEGFTGKTAVDYGLKAKEQIRAASEVQKRDRDEVMP